MEGEEIGLILARAAAPPTSAPASKISVCVAAAVARPPPQRDAEVAVKRLGAGEEEVESLIGMNDALESLERQLASLQGRIHRVGFIRLKSTLHRRPKHPPTFNVGALPCHACVTCVCVTVSKKKKKRKVGATREARWTGLREQKQEADAAKRQSPGPTHVHSHPHVPTPHRSHTAVPSQCCDV